MNTFMIIFCIIAAVFAISTLFYVGGSTVKQVQERRSAGTPQKTNSEPMPAGSGGWLLLGSLVGTAAGVLTAYISANPKERKKKVPKKKT